MSQRFRVFDCNIIYLPGSRSHNGTVTTVENRKEIPFEISRVYYLYDIPGGASRGGHAHKNLEQFIIPICGSFDITLNDGVNKKTVQLNRSNLGLYLRPGIWREIENFSSGAICLVFASEKFDEDDYIREYDEFKMIYGAN
ncbi:MAG: sugar 3,4-ketoisomerase [Chitinophagales bacterium]